MLNEAIVREVTVRVPRQHGTQVLDFYYFRCRYTFWSIFKFLIVKFQRAVIVILEQWCLAHDFLNRN